MKFFSLVSLSTMVFMVIHNDHYLTKCIATSGVPESLGDANKQDESSDGADQLENGKYSSSICGCCKKPLTVSEMRMFTCGHTLCERCVNLSLKLYQKYCRYCEENKKTNKKTNNSKNNEFIRDCLYYIYGSKENYKINYATHEYIEHLLSSNNYDLSNSDILELKRRFSGE
ncbi:uncharacterized protein LOC126902341 [Daktulosphaira vitifoliae]|uniref:uncharacterized protein LOC126902341 n=1 Tax=Daktulosphaira vitifoliae TaxID=58002 RepID=UPI0021AAE2AB|nr:uncharacterized protein LOC126902341 [Daktulosphaira vitifoliae]